jgi:hypothetical protein
MFVVVVLSVRCVICVDDCRGLVDGVHNVCGLMDVGFVSRVCVLDVGVGVFAFGFSVDFFEVFFQGTVFIRAMFFVNMDVASEQNVAFSVGVFFVA